MKTREKSKKVYESLCEVIPGGVNSPVRACKDMGQMPLVVDRAVGDCIIDVDDHSYIDFCGSWGALLHGHAHPEILSAVSKRLRMGTTFGATSSIEEKLARKVVELMPSIEKIRFVSSGTEATMSAVRLARGFTGRPLIIKFDGNYHGHADFFLVKAGSGVSQLQASSSQGIPDEMVRHTICLPFNDIQACREIFRKHPQDIAAVILEPIAGNMGVVPATHEFMQMLREETEKIGALLIYDEVMTGFRVAKGGAQELYGIQPDLTCLAKIVGGGFPAAAFGGRREIMDFLAPLGPVYQAGTLSGNPVAMEAGLKALELLDVPGFYPYLEEKTNIITQPVKKLIQEKNMHACIQQSGSMFTLFFGITQVNNMDDARRSDKEAFAKFFRYMFDHGVYIPPLHVEAWFVSSVHTQANLEHTRDLILAYLN